jgi:hypothetical protein
MKWLAIRIAFLILAFSAGLIAAYSFVEKPPLEWIDVAVIAPIFAFFIFMSLFYHYKKPGAKLPWRDHCWTESPLNYNTQPIEWWYQVGWNCYAFGVGAIMCAAPLNFGLIPFACLFLLFGISVQLDIAIWKKFMPSTITKAESS